MKYHKKLIAIITFLNFSCFLTRIRMKRRQTAFRRVQVPLPVEMSEVPEIPTNELFIFNGEQRETLDFKQDFRYSVFTNDVVAFKNGNL